MSSKKLPSLILLGAPGSGKGTQGKNLVSEFKYNHVSTGDLLRAEIKKSSNLGLRLKDIMDTGMLVDDQTVLELLQANCDLSTGAYIFDGFPRNSEQAEMLDLNLIKGADSLAVYFEMDQEELVKRIVNRRVAPKSGQIYNLISKPPRVAGKCDESGEDLVHRTDDTEEVVRERLKIFNENNNSLLDYYSAAKRLVKINADQALEDVWNQLKSVISRT